MNASEIKSNLQRWYDDVNWYGKVETPIGTLFERDVHDLAKKYFVKLEYNCPA